MNESQNKIKKKAKQETISETKVCVLIWILEIESQFHQKIKKIKTQIERSLT